MVRPRESPGGGTLDLRAGRGPGRGHGDAALGLQLTLGEGKVVWVQPRCASGEAVLNVHVA